MMTDSELAILTLIAERPRHGYEIEEVIEQRGMRNWTEIGFSSIYYVLKRLEQAGWITGQLEPAERGPARKVYRVTPAGTDALRQAAIQALSEPAPLSQPLLLGLANLPLLDTGEAVRSLSHYRDTIRARRDEVEAAREAQRPLAPFVEALFAYSLRLIEAELEWLDEFIVSLRDAMTTPATE